MMGKTHLATALGHATYLGHVSGETGASLFSSTMLGVLAVAGPNPVELGVKFQSSQAGTINALRFYKRTQNTGTHTATSEVPRAEC
jgi:hypothetical protein